MKKLAIFTTLGVIFALTALPVLALETGINYAQSCKDC